MNVSLSGAKKLAKEFGQKVKVRGRNDKQIAPSQQPMQEDSIAPGGVEAGPFLMTPALAQGSSLPQILLTPPDKNKAGPSPASGGKIHAKEPKIYVKINGERVSLRGMGNIDLKQLKEAGFRSTLLDEFPEYKLTEGQEITFMNSTSREVIRLQYRSTDENGVANFDTSTLGVFKE